MRISFGFVAYLVVGLDVQLDLFAGEGADSGWGREDWSAFLCFCFGEMRGKRRGIYLICMLGELVVVVYVRM